jgi:hypothetical protein
MATRDRVIQSNPARLLVADHTEQPEQSVIGKAWQKIISSRVAKSIVSVFTAAMIVVAIVTIGNPIALFVATSRVSTSAPEDFKRQSMPTIQSSASAQALPPAAAEPPRGGELLAAFRTALEGKTEVDQPKAGALFNQFQAWAATEDVPLQVRPPQPVQDAPAQVVQRTQPPPLPKRRPIQTARSQAPSAQNADWSMQRLGWHN